ncbi:MAG TPA: FG-GAP-like repeat-containing protein [Flavobacteriales bacterium]|nr:FG-GAP-like repeat-containing protein [Flavobacteriales bacterium]
MLKHFTLGLSALVCTSSLMAQLSFTNASNLMSNVTLSGGCMGVVDMNGDGLDDIAKLHNAREFQVDYQNADGTFTLVNYGQVSSSGQWGWAIADLDNNGHKDMVSGGSYDGTHYVRITSPGVKTLEDLNGPDIFTQAMSIGDMDNNGRLDVFACHDDGPPNLWFTNTSGVPLNNNAYIDWTTNPSSDMSGNYGSCFSDFDSDGDIDLYIAKCRQGVNDPNDNRRWDRLFVNDGNNNYTDQALEYGVQNRNQTWTTDLGDIDNDGDLDMVATNHDATIQLFENDGTGHFTDITDGCGMEQNGFMLQSKFVDFDNDGFLDVLIAGGDEYFFTGNGDGTFDQVTGMFPSGKDMHSFATGDLNNDGFQDVFANYGSNYITVDANNPDRLWMNDGNDNHWFTVRLKGTISNRDAVGAQVRITGPWGTQVREVKAGESYGMVTTFACSFGLGQYTTIPTLTIRWPSGLVETFNDLEADRTINVIEATCISPEATISTTQAPIICGNGDVLELTANDGYNYLWSTGETTRSIDVDLAGNYSVTIDDGDGCSASTSIFVQQSPDETPTISLDGERTLCEGGSVVLTSSPASSYTWSNGITGQQSITVNTADAYTVMIEGLCGEFTSEAVDIDVLDAPDAPVADDVSTPINTSTTLEATGENIQWFDQAVGGAVVGTGNTFNTPVLTADVSYWASATTIHAGEQAFGGRTNNSVNGLYHTNTDNYQLFTAFEDMIIRSVKVYANGTANRTIAVIDQGNGSTIATGTFNIPNGESRVQLNFNVPAGGPYGLRLVGGNPQLWRDGAGSNPAYPFALGTLGSMTSSTASGSNALAYYYFFYDIEVKAPDFTCTGPRTEVEVNVGSTDTGIGEHGAGDGVTIWPNPTQGNVTVALGTVQGRVSIDVLDVTGRLVMAVNADAASQLNGLVTMDLGTLAPGEYALNVRHAKGTSIHRVVVQ